jgi:hypothetical protein
MIKVLFLLRNYGLLLFHRKLLLFLVKLGGFNFSNYCETDNTKQRDTTAYSFGSGGGGSGRLTL